METEKRLRSASTDKKTEKSKTPVKCSCSGDRRKKEERIKEGFQTKNRSYKASLIPVLKGEKIDLKYIAKKPKEPVRVLCSCSCAKRDKRDEDFERKLRTLEAKEKAVAEYYQKIEETLRKIVIFKDQKEEGEPVKDSSGTCQNIARKMTSEPTVLSSGKVQNSLLTDFENNVEQISSIWLKTSSDLYRTLKNLKKNSSLDPMEFEVENVKVELAIKQAKSLTLMKTRSVIADAKKLYRHSEMIRIELEKLLRPEILKPGNGHCALSQGEREERTEKTTPTENQNVEAINADGTGDCSKKSDLDITEDGNSIEEIDEEKMKPVKKCSQERAKITGEVSQSCNPKECTDSLSEISGREIKNLAAELTKKNETITSLNHKIFELQKTCNEHLHRYSELQVKLSEFQEKSQWNQVLWKQIGKLKDQIMGLQQSNKQLESNKKELENKISKLDKELERLIKLNHFLNQKKYLLNAHESCGKNCKIKVDDTKSKSNDVSTDDEECKNTAEEKVLADKQNAIKQLKMIMDAMKDQENFAQKQIAIFQSKIEALEKKS